MAYNPGTDAPDPTPRKFKNTIEIVACEIITIGEAVSRQRLRQLPDETSPDIPYWDLHYRALDAKREADGSFLDIHSGSKLFDKEGRQLDKRQRPHKIASAYAGLGVPVFPGDPDGKFDAWCAANCAEEKYRRDGIGTISEYDAARVVGNKFIVETPPRDEWEASRNVGRPLPLPVVELGPAYVYTGKVRTVPQRSDGDSQVNEQGAVAPANLVDVLTDDGAKEQVLGIIAGQAADADFFDVLRQAGIDNRILLDGQSILAVAVNGDLIETLTAQKVVAVDDGKVVAAA